MALLLAQILRLAKKEVHARLIRIRVGGKRGKEHRRTAEYLVRRGILRLDRANQELLQQIRCPGAVEAVADGIV